MKNYALNPSLELCSGQNAEGGGLANHCVCVWGGGAQQLLGINVAEDIGHDNSTWRNIAILRSAYQKLLIKVTTLFFHAPGLQD